MALLIAVTTLMDRFSVGTSVFLVDMDASVERRTNNSTFGQESLYTVVSIHLRTTERNVQLKVIDQAAVLKEEFWTRLKLATALFVSMIMMLL